MGACGRFFAEKKPAFSALCSKAGGEVFFRRRDGHQVVLLLQSGGNTRRDESRKCRAEADVFDAESQQRHQDTDGLLLEPAENEGKGQLVDRTPERIRQSERDLDGTVCVVALADIEDTGQTGDRSQRQVIEPELSAGQRQNDRIRRRQLGKLGVVAVFADFVSQHLVGIDWFWASFIISATFVYSQYFFASGTARITALFSAFAAILVAMGAPIPFTILLFGLMNSPGCTLTHYSSGVTPIFFGAGYVPQGTWWRVGLAISVVSFLIHFWGGTLGMWLFGIL